MPENVRALCPARRGHRHAQMARLMTITHQKQAKCPPPEGRRGTEGPVCSRNRTQQPGGPQAHIRRPVCARGRGCSRPPHISLPGARPGCTARLCHSPATCVWVSHISHLGPRCSTVDGVKLRVLVKIKQGSAHGALSPEPGRQKCPRVSVSLLSPSGHNDVLMTPIFPASRIQPCPRFGQ